MHDFGAPKRRKIKMKIKVMKGIKSKRKSRSRIFEW
jgi:hypothetical protein